MNRCDQARRLFDALWDDEVTQAEREWLEGHLGACPACRHAYEQYARTLEAVAALPRVETSRDLAERALAAARRAQPVPDRLAVAPPTPRWVPVTAAAALVLVTLALLLPTISPRVGTRPGGSLTARVEPAPVGGPRLLATAGPSPAAAPGATLADSLFDRSEDVEFILDPVVLHRGRARPAGNLPAGVQAEQVVISF